MKLFCYCTVIDDYCLKLLTPHVALHIRKNDAIMHMANWSERDRQRARRFTG